MYIIWDGKSNPSAQKTPSIIDANIYLIDPLNEEPIQRELFFYGISFVTTCSPLTSFVTRVNSG